MQHIVNQINCLLIKNKKKIAVAESCTGGLTSNLLTQNSGSSQYFTLGVVAYSNAAKIKFLKIRPSLILKKGAVSKDVADKMAYAVRKLAKADFGIGISGIAGPTGGSIQKPVGTVFIALNGKNKKILKSYIFKGGRLAIRKKAALKALELLKSSLTS